MPELHPLTDLLVQIRACTHCAAHLPLGARPVLRASPTARILLVGQAPGTKVHASGIPWDDKSGDRLRQWMGLDKATFYDESKIAIIPMGFCYPGRGKSGDLPPRPECARLWREQLHALLPQIELTILIGAYAIDYYLKNTKAKTLTETVQQWHHYWPAFIPLVHPSPRNEMWLRRNPWFEADIVPVLREGISLLL